MARLIYNTNKKINNGHQNKPYLIGCVQQELNTKPGFLSKHKKYKYFHIFKTSTVSSLSSSFDFSSIIQQALHNRHTHCYNHDLFLSGKHCPFHQISVSQNMSWPSYSLHYMYQFTGLDCLSCGGALVSHMLGSNFCCECIIAM